MLTGRKPGDTSLQPGPVAGRRRRIGLDTGLPHHPGVPTVSELRGGIVDYLKDIDYAASGFGEFYDELPLWSAPFGLLLLEHVPVKRGITILDLGAGTGFLTIELAERCGPDASVIAVDPWQAGMARLRRMRDQRGLHNVVLVVQDAATVDLPDASVDLIVSNLGINNFDDPAAVLRTCFRAARPGASLVLTTNPVGHMAEFYEVYRETLIALGQPDSLAALDAHINHRGTIESVTDLLHAAGFDIVEVLRKSFPMRFADGSSFLRHHFIRLGFIPGWKAVADARSVEKTFDTLERRLNAVAAARGEMAVTIPVACVVAQKPLAPKRKASAHAAASC
jgi:arsenite methyltransferase